MPILIYSNYFSAIIVANTKKKNILFSLQSPKSYLINFLIIIEYERYLTTEKNKEEQREI